MNEITEKAPEQIWLHEIQWINSGQVETVWRDRRNAPGDVAYVRTDLFNSVSKEILTATNELEAAQKRIAELERLNLSFAQNEQQVEALRGFAQDIMECWPHSELDGCDLQDIAETHGILRLEERAEPCGENCACAEYGDFPAECYRKTELLTGQ